MDSAHAGHDVQMSNRVVVANGAAIGGHAIIEDHVIIGGNSGVHQFVRLGRGCFLSGSGGSALDVMPWFLVTLLNVAGSINIVGLRRHGFAPEQVDTVRWVYRLFCRSGLPVAAAKERLAERAGDPVVDEYLTFLSKSSRALCTMRGRRDGRERVGSVESR